MLEGSKYRIGSVTDLEILLSLLEQSYTVAKPKSSNFVFSIFDTFSWDLFKKKKYLYTIENKLYFQSYKGRRKRIKITPQKHFLPATDITNSAEFQSIKKLTGRRAVSQRAKWEVKQKVFPLFNKNSKKVAAVYFEKFTIKTQTVLLVRIVQSSGFIDDFEFINIWAEKNNLQKAKNNSFQILLNERNIFPLKYTSKIHLECNPDTPVFLAVREIFEKGRNNLLANFTGLKKDLDTEFLHDFRTTSRRLKSAISQFKNTCHRHTYDKIKYHLTYLQKSTNELRDLDVDILGKNEYFKLIPEEYSPELNKLFEHLCKKREAAFENFIQKVESLEINHSIQQLNTFVFHLYPENDKIPEKAREPIKENADIILKSRFEKIVNQGNLLNENSADPEIHALRLHCKKLRYSLEFFKNYYPEKRIGSFISRLKELQDNLGRFNDLSVQIERLSFFKEEFSSFDKTSDVLNLLLKLKTNQKDEIRNEFNLLLKRFLSKRTINSFYKLFSN